MNYKYSILGKVIEGKKRGKKMGFATANIRLHKKIPEGIYLSHISLDNKKYCALTFIGSALTFGEKDVKAESYIFSFNQTIYGKFITVNLIKKIRENKKFNSEEELVRQMELDKKIAEEYFEI